MAPLAMRAPLTMRAMMTTYLRKRRPRGRGFAGVLIARTVSPPAASRRSREIPAPASHVHAGPHRRGQGAMVGSLGGTAHAGQAAMTVGDEGPHAESHRAGQGLAIRGRRVGSEAARSQDAGAQ